MRVKPPTTMGEVGGVAVITRDGMIGPPLPRAAGLTDVAGTGLDGEVD